MTFEQKVESTNHVRLPANRFTKKQRIVPRQRRAKKSENLLQKGEEDEGKKQSGEIAVTA